MNRIRLKFKVLPRFLQDMTYVEDPVSIVFVNMGSPLVDMYLGQSGRRMAEAGFPFIFERKIAESLIKADVAVRDDTVDGEY